MEKKLRLIYCGLFLSILCSIIAVVFSLYRVAPFTMSEATYIGILVSLMGIIFTIFVGYQIYNVIDIKRELKHLDIQKARLEDTVKKLSNYQIVSEAYNLNNRGMLAISMNSYETAIHLLLQALEVFLSSRLDDRHWNDIENIKTNIKYCYSKMGNFRGTNCKEELYQISTNIMNSENYRVLNKEFRDLIVDIKRSNN
ncbi:MULTISPECIES: hypothetical protein [Sanguibacteroides]|nr:MULTISPECIES: hypothetical protein [Sanguibacteroides]